MRLLPDRLFERVVFSQAGRVGLSWHQRDRGVGVDRDGFHRDRAGVRQDDIGQRADEAFCAHAAHAVAAGDDASGNRRDDIGLHVRRLVAFLDLVEKHEAWPCC